MSVLTNEEKLILERLEIPSSKLLDATNLARAQYTVSMTNYDKWIALGTTPCKKFGHRMRVKNGHCLQCNEKNYSPQSLWRQSQALSGQLYIFGSKTGGFLKVSSSLNSNEQLKNMNDFLYAGFSDWVQIVLYEVEEPSQKEFLIEQQLSEFLQTASSQNANNTFQYFDLFRCKFIRIQKTIENLIENSGAKCLSFNKDLADQFNLIDENSGKIVKTGSKQQRDAALKMFAQSLPSLGASRKKNPIFMGHESTSAEEKEVKMEISLKSDHKELNDDKTWETACYYYSDLKKVFNRVKTCNETLSKNFKQRLIKEKSFSSAKEWSEELVKNFLNEQLSGDFELIELAENTMEKDKKLFSELISAVSILGVDSKKAIFEKLIEDFPDYFNEPQEASDKNNQTLNEMTAHQTQSSSDNDYLSEGLKASGIKGGDGEDRIFPQMPKADIKFIPTEEDNESQLIKMRRMQVERAAKADNTKAAFWIIFAGPGIIFFLLYSCS